MQVIESIPCVWFFGDFKRGGSWRESDLQTIGRKAQSPKAANPEYRTPSSLSAQHGQLANLVRLAVHGRGNDQRDADDHRTHHDRQGSILVVLDLFAY